MAVSPINKDKALDAALTYLETHYGLSPEDYELYGVEIKQFDEAQQFDYVSPRKDVYFKITFYAKLIIILPGENVIESLSVWVEENGNISASTGSAPSVEGSIETIPMKLTSEKKKIKVEIDQILKENLGTDTGVHQEMSTKNPLVVTFTDVGYKILKGKPTYPVYQYEYTRKDNQLTPYETGLETHGGNNIPEPGAIPEPSGTVERIESLNGYLNKR